MGETLNAQRNQQSNSNNNKYIAEAAVSATRATRTSSSISLLIYLYRNSFRPCPLPPAPPSTQPLPLRPQPFFSLLLSSIVYMLRASFDMPAELNWVGEQQNREGVNPGGNWVKDDINIIAISFIFAGLRCRLKFRWQRLCSARILPCFFYPSPDFSPLPLGCLLYPRLEQDKSGGQFVFHFAAASHSFAFASYSI